MRKTVALSFCLVLAAPFVSTAAAQSAAPEATEPRTVLRLRARIKALEARLDELAERVDAQHAELAELRAQRQQQQPTPLAADPLPAEARLLAGEIERVRDSLRKLRRSYSWTSMNAADMEEEDELKARLKLLQTRYDSFLLGEGVVLGESEEAKEDQAPRHDLRQLILRPGVRVGDRLDVAWSRREVARPRAKGSEDVDLQANWSDTVEALSPDASSWIGSVRRQYHYIKSPKLEFRQSRVANVMAYRGSRKGPHLFEWGFERGLERGLERSDTQAPRYSRLPSPYLGLHDQIAAQQPGFVTFAQALSPESLLPSEPVAVGESWNIVGRPKQNLIQRWLPQDQPALSARTGDMQAELVSLDLEKSVARMVIKGTVEYSCLPDTRGLELGDLIGRVPHALVIELDYTFPLQGGIPTARLSEKLRLTVFPKHFHRMPIGTIQQSRALHVELRRPAPGAGASEEQADDTDAQQAKDRFVAKYSLESVVGLEMLGGFVVTLREEDGFETLLRVGESIEGFKLIEAKHSADGLAHRALFEFENRSGVQVLLTCVDEQDSPD